MYPSQGFSFHTYRELQIDRVEYVIKFNIISHGNILYRSHPLTLFPFRPGD
jgi:hypothetical protein